MSLPCETRFLSNHCSMGGALQGKSWRFVLLINYWRLMDESYAVETKMLESVHAMFPWSRSKCFPFRDSDTNSWKCLNSNQSSILYCFVLVRFCFSDSWFHDKNNINNRLSPSYIISIPIIVCVIAILKCLLKFGSRETKNQAKTKVYLGTLYFYRKKKTITGFLKNSLHIYNRTVLARSTKKYIKSNTSAFLFNLVNRLQTTMQHYLWNVFSNIWYL